MTADTTARNSPLRVHQDREDNLPRVETKIDSVETGSSGRAVNYAGAESSLTFRDQIQDNLDGLLGWAKDFFVPPSHLISAPPGWPQLTAYAHNGVRMQKAPALLQGLSALWLYAVALPIVMIVLTRPGRALLTIGIVELFLRTTGAGHWIGNLIRGVAHVLAIAFLP
jgi:hypothetical protein